PAGGQVERRQRREAEGRIEKRGAVARKHQLLVGTHLAGADFEPSVPQLLLEPEVEKLGVARRLDAADELEAADPVGRRRASVDLQAAGLDRGAGPAQQLFEIERQGCGGQPVIDGAPPRSTGEVAPNLALFLHRERDPLLFEPRAEAAPIAGQELRLVGARGRADRHYRGAEENTERGRRHSICLSATAEPRQLPHSASPRGREPGYHPPKSDREGPRDG